VNYFVRLCVFSIMSMWKENMLSYLFLALGGKCSKDEKENKA
jgi:hypothetical protein